MPARAVLGPPAAHEGGRGPVGLAPIDSPGGESRLPHDSREPRTRGDGCRLLCLQSSL